MNDILMLFDLEPARVPATVPPPHIPGSPERCLERLVREDAQGNLWLLERLAPLQRERRESIAALLSGLAAAGAPHVRPFRQCTNGTSVADHGSGAWQCSPFITGIELPRPDYIDDAWRGTCTGEFIAGLQRAGGTLATIPEAGTPPLPDYIASLANTIQARQPDVYNRIHPMLPHFAPLFAMLPSLPTAIAHGDCHPLNIIWGRHAINGIIDWEFTGRKPVLYDAANCIGCVGFEHPDWLVRGFIPALIRTLSEHGILDDATAPMLLPFTCALRFAWLSEWLRRDDQEMICMELDYMDILIRHGKAIEQAWEACRT